MEIHFLPRALTAQPQKDEPENDHAVLRVGDDVEIVIVSGGRRRGVNPWQHKENINVGPPGQQQAEIEISQTSVDFTALAVRLKGECSHEGDAAQEEQKVTRIQPRNGPMKINLIIRPLKLPDHPQRAAQRDEHPEDIAPPVWGTGVEEQPSIGHQRRDTLDNVSKDNESLRTAMKRQGGARVEGQDDQPYAYGPCDGTGSNHTLINSSIDFQQASGVSKISGLVGILTITGETRRRVG